MAAKPASQLKERAWPSVGSKPSFPIVGAGASAGGLEAFTAFLTNLPSAPGMAFVLIQHLDPKQPSQLTDLLSKATRMPVLEVKTDTAVEINHVYVIAPDVSLEHIGRAPANGAAGTGPSPADRSFPAIAGTR